MDKQTILTEKTIALMMRTETVPETLDFNELTRLSAREEFINFSRRESFTSYKKKLYFYVFLTSRTIHFRYFKYL
jgi:hypothetical protein